MQAQAALAELHRLRICHGDVYAHNVLVDDDGSAVLLDYGERTERTAGSMRLCGGVYCAHGIVQDPWSYHCAVIGGCSASAVCALRAVGHAGSLKCDRLTTSVAGASFFYQPDTLPFEAQEVRAFGLLLADMAARIAAAGWSRGGGSDARHNGTDTSGAAADASTMAGLGTWLRGWVSGREQPAAAIGASSVVDMAAPNQTAGVSGSGSGGSGIASQLADLAAQCTTEAVGNRPSFVDLCQQLQHLSAAVLSSE